MGRFHLQPELCANPAIGGANRGALLSVPEDVLVGFRVHFRLLLLHRNLLLLGLGVPQTRRLRLLGRGMLGHL